MNMKRVLPLLVLLLAATSLFGASILGKDSFALREGLFYSEAELEKFGFVQSVHSREKSYYEKCDIYLLTGGPGSIVWENFGHSSYVVAYPDGSEIAYDYGIFSFDEDFFLNFALGKLYYEAWASWADYRTESLIEDDRDVSLLKLNLDSDQKYTLIKFLEYNTRPENSVYLYDYYYDNCATRLRDSYNAATGGDFKAWAEGVDVEETLRDLSERYLSRSTFPVDYAITFLLGPIVDKEINLWDAMFLPEILERGIMEYQASDREVIYKSVGRDDTPERYNFLLRTILMSLVLSAIVLLSHSKKKSLRITFGVLSSLIYLILTLMELALLFLMTASIHFVTYWNMNVLIMAPAIPLFGMHILYLSKRERGEKCIKAFAKAALLYTLVLLLIKLVLSSILIQETLPYFILMISLYAAEIKVVEIRKSH